MKNDNLFTDGGETLSKDAQVLQGLCTFLMQTKHEYCRTEFKINSSNLEMTKIATFSKRLWLFLTFHQIIPDV